MRVDPPEEGRLTAGGGFVAKSRVACPRLHEHERRVACPRLHGHERNPGKDRQHALASQGMPPMSLGPPPVGAFRNKDYLATKAIEARIG